MDKHHLQQLIDKVLSGRASAQEQAELDAWYAAQGENEGITSRLDEEHKSAYGKQLFERITQEIEEPQLQQESIAVMPYATRRTNYTFWVAAAAILLVIATGGVWYMLNRPSAPQQPLAVWKQEAAGAEVKKLSLPDGSSIWLNAASSLRYDTNFTSGKREVWLEGEAYFDVAHNEQKPFEVHTGQYTTRVLGTAFNIDAYKLADSVMVTVTRGKVRVADSATESGILYPDERLTVKPTGGWNKEVAIKADNNTAWTTGQLVFRDMKFSEVANRLERRFGVQLVFKNTGIAQCPITATFHDNTPLKEILDILATVNDSKITPGESGNKYYISGSKNCN